MNIDELFKNTVRTSYQAKRTYDVRITLNKDGKGGYAIRFGFLNKAVEVIGGKPYAQVSSVCKCRNRIYFRFLDKKNYLDIYKISRPRDAKSMYIQFSVSDKEEKIYRSDWIQGTFKMQYDEACQLYYIAKGAE